MSNILRSRLDRFDKRYAKSGRYTEIVEEKVMWSSDSGDLAKDAENLLKAGNLDEDAAIVFTPKGMSFFSSLIEGIMVKNMLTPQRVEEIVSKVVHREMLRFSGAIATAFQSIAQDIEKESKKEILREASSCSEYLEMMRKLREDRESLKEAQEVPQEPTKEFSTESSKLRKYELMLRVLKEQEEPMRITDLTRMTEERYG